MVRGIRRLVHASRAKIRDVGLFAFAMLLWRKLVQRLRVSRCNCSEQCRALVSGARCLEIGGPSRIFSRSGELPVYDIAAAVDGLNYSAETLWAEGLGDDRPFAYGKAVLGRQYVREATDLQDIASGSYDFVLSSHAIEHLANPLRGLGEWKRVLRDGGSLILVVPHKEGTFDHKRPVTAIEHIIEDFHTNMGEDDATHIPEVLEMHDFKRDFWLSDRDEFVARCQDNLRNRALHHHVFDTDLVVRMVDQAGFSIMAVDHALPNNIVIVATKGGTGPLPENTGLLERDARWRRESPFSSDKVPAKGAVTP